MSLFKFVLVLIAFLQNCHVHGQNCHDRIESIFSDLTVSNVIDRLNMDIVVFNGSVEVQSVIGRSRELLYRQIKNACESNELDSLELLRLKDQFYYDLETSINSIEQTDPPVAIETVNGPCSNVDFESGGLAGWDLETGHVAAPSLFSYYGGIPALPGINHEITTVGGIDPNVGISTTFPGGIHSVRLGDLTPGSNAARMSQTFLVDANNQFFTYNYAVVFESPDNSHTVADKPYFTVRLYDQNGYNIPCGEYSVSADPSVAVGFQSVNPFPDYYILYKDWSSVMTNLTAYIGQNVTAVFTTGDCTQFGHFGYAYIDASCSRMEITTTNSVICTNGNSILSAPVGALSYLWNTGETTQNITVTSGGTYTCDIVPFQGSGCSVTLSIVITTSSVIGSLVDGGNDQTVCQGSPVMLSGSGASSYVWSGGIFNLVTFTPAISGIYTVTGVMANGCTSSDFVNVIVIPMPNNAAGFDQTICLGGSVTLNGVGTWSGPVSLISGVPFNPPIGVHSLTLTNIVSTIPACIVVDQVVITVNPVPVVNGGLDVSVCLGDSVVLTGTGSVVYNWSNQVFNGISFNPIVTNNYTVSTTNSFGCVSTDIVLVTVNPLPVVNAGIDQTVCLGTAVTLTGAGANNGYVWSNGVVNNVAFTPAVGTIVYTVTGTNLTGCQNTDVVNVTVNPNPAPIINGAVSYCIGSSSTLSTSVPFTSYAWSTPAVTPTTSVTTANNPITVTVENSFGCIGVSSDYFVTEIPESNSLDSILICYGDTALVHGIPQSVAGVYTQTITGGSISGCDSTSNIVLIVSIPIVNAGLDQIICSGQIATLTGTGAGVGANYLWNNGVIDASAFTPAVGALNYVVTGTNANGCVDTDTVNVLVNALPIINAGLDQVICIGASVTLTGSNGNTYVWNNGVLNAIAFNPIATNTYTVTGTDVNGCIDTDQVLVTVNVLPVVNAGNDLIICNGTTALLTGSGASTYVWTNAVTDGVAFTPAGTNSYTVTGTDVNGCIDTDVVTVTIENAPVISFTPDNVIGCTPVTVTFTNTTTGATSTTWIFNDGTTVSGNGDQTHTFTAPGCYDIVMIAESANGCTSTFTATDMVCVEAYPLALFTPSPNTMTNIFTEVEFDNNSIDADMSSWTFGDDTQSNQTNPTHVYPNAGAGSYLATLIVSTNYGCTDTISQMITVTEDVIFYIPNTFTPDDDEFNEGFLPIFTSGFDPQDYVMFIFDRWGEIIFETHDTTVGWRASYGAANVDIVQDGTYIWRIEFKTTNAKRIMKTGHVNVLR
jgi:gliding motility-associated-like protein